MKRRNPIIKGVFDAGPSMFDRYTIVYNVRNPRNGFYECLGASAHPYAPGGFGQHGECQYGRHLGRRISLSQLPREVVKVVQADLEAYSA